MYKEQREYTKEKKAQWKFDLCIDLPFHAVLFLPLENLRTSDFVMLSRGIEMDYWHESA